MGHGITVTTVYIRGGTFYRGNIVDDAYLSYNWGDCHQIWNICADMSGRKSSDVIARLARASKTLDEMGIRVGTPDLANLNWGFGTTMRDGKDRGNYLPREERLGVFYYHLKQFHSLATKYPACYFLTDSCDGTSIIVDEKSVALITEETSQESESGDQEPPQIAFPARHPVRGTTLIKTKEDALELFGLMRFHDREGAKKWLKAADMLPSEDALEL